VLRDAAAAHPGRVVQATSLGAEDMVVTDLIARHGLPVALGTLDTGKLHAQTLALMRRIESHYGVPVAVVHPAAGAVIAFVHRHGERAMFDSVELRKACCAVRKLEPLGRLLEGRSAWVTGLRREQSEHRARGAVRRDRRRRPRQVQPAGRLELGRRVALHRHARRALQPAARPVLSQHRLRALHPRHRAGRGLPRRPLVVGAGRRARECGLHVNTPEGATA
jgi:3'-phosphoadenosine 5'-phosphosulfate sulfotransferase (PAPS reductase)/FAD synthetase